MARKATDKVAGYEYVGGSSCELQSIPGVPGLWLPGEGQDPARYGLSASEFGELVAAAGADEVFQACEVEPWQPEAEAEVPQAAVADAETTTTEE